ncbi:hypothetical protein VZO05_11850 [Aggregatilineales bacterium SYSU G02658]
MRKLIVIPLSLVSLIAVIFMCGTMTFAGLFLASMQVLTGRVVAAEVVMFPIQTDNNGDFIEIEFTPIETQSALAAALTGGSAGEPTRGAAERFRLYGDVVAVRGPLITLRPLMQMFGLQNVYQLAVIEGVYRGPQANRQLQGSRAVLNGGFDPVWWDLNNQEGRFPYNVFIERITISGDEEFGFRGSGLKRYHIVVTNQSITWDLVEERR